MRSAAWAEAQGCTARIWRCRTKCHGFPSEHCTLQANERERQDGRADIDLPAAGTKRSSEPTASSIVQVAAGELPERRGRILENLPRFVRSASLNQGPVEGDPDGGPGGVVHALVVPHAEDPAVARWMDRTTALEGSHPSVADLVRRYAA